jgi:hypothetical protein
MSLYVTKMLCKYSCAVSSAYSYMNNSGLEKSMAFFEKYDDIFSVILQ